MCVWGGECGREMSWRRGGRIELSILNAAAANSIMHVLPDEAEAGLFTLHTCTAVFF